MNTIPPPPEWGKDKLSEYLEAVRKNYFAGYATNRHRYGHLQEIDDCFVRILDGWINPPEPLAASLFYRSHSAFRTAAGQSLAGQLVEAYAVMRLCLEFAGYGLHIFEDPALGMTWINRHQDQTSFGGSIGEFTRGKIRATISTHDSKLSDVYEMLYLRAVDFGAHPNERSVSGAMNIVDETDQSRFVHAHLQGPGLAMEHALKTTVQVGVCALRLMQFFAPARFELLGVKHRLQTLRKQDI
jgi:hypothetical protein